MTWNQEIVGSDLRSIRGHDATDGKGTEKTERFKPVIGHKKTAGKLGYKFNALLCEAGHKIRIIPALSSGFAMTHLSSEIVSVDNSVSPQPFLQARSLPGATARICSSQIVVSLSRLAFVQSGLKAQEQKNAEGKLPQQVSAIEQMT